MRYNCAHCGGEFSAKPFQKRRFCSASCYHSAESKRRADATPQIPFTCGNCGKKFHFQPGQLRAYRKAWGKDPMYCSRACGFAGRRAAGDARNTVACVVCGSTLTPVRRDDGTLRRPKLYCSVACKGIAKGAMYHARNPDREATRSVTRQGYIRIRIPIPGKKRREVLEHRYVMEQALGRELRDDETVHHRNGQRSHNALSNLELRSGNHGPGGDVSAMVRWAHEIIDLYPQFDREGVFHPVVVAAVQHEVA